MSSSPESVENYKEVVDSVRAFNEGLKEGGNLKNQLSYFRAWYYIPELDAVGPSKFIGYKNLSLADYLTGYGLDGKVTEPVLGRWFNLLIDNTPEARYVESLVERLLARYNKVMNRKARFNAPRGWNLRKGNVTPLQSNAQINTQTDDLNPMVEVFWRAFLSLSQKDQDILARRIIALKGV